MIWTSGIGLPLREYGRLLRTSISNHLARRVTVRGRTSNLLAGVQDVTTLAHTLNLQTVT